MTAEDLRHMGQGPHMAERNYSHMHTIREEGPAELYESFSLGMSDYRKTATTSKQGTESLFTNFEDVRLTDEERVYLNAAATGDVGILRQSLEEAKNNSLFNVNCVDYMGRNALHLGVDSENSEAIETLLDYVSFECIEEALLHAISKGNSKTVRLIMEHPNYMACEDRVKRTDYNNAFFRLTEKSQFSPDITPLILAAHYNNHEMVQMFLSRNHTIEKPHAISCQCTDCQVKQNYDSLKRSRSRLNAYRALASPAYMALSSHDPIMTTFELRQEMMLLAEVEKEFKKEYLTLVEQCMNFACQMMDLCRGTQEVEAVISEYMDDGEKVKDPLGRLRMAIRYEEKKFVAHPNCQQYLTSLWYGPETAFLQSWTLLRKVGLCIISFPCIPVLCMIYVACPTSKIAKAMRCPVVKFATHSISHFLFLLLLAAATIRSEDSHHNIQTTEDLQRYTGPNRDDSIRSLVKEKLRPASNIVTNFQILIVLWVIGNMLSDVKQVFYSGILKFLYNNQNIIHFIIVSMYLASYTLRFITERWVREADEFYNGTRNAFYYLSSENYTAFTEHLETISNSDSTKRYFMQASRFEWNADDPEIVSDVLFAMANVMSFARTTTLMPAFEILGPLQISFNRMVTDITRFMVLFVLVLVAFMVGLHNLYWYYGGQTFSKPTDNGNGTAPVFATELFEGLQHTLYSLFWSIFGQVQLGNMPIRHPTQPSPKYSDGMVDSASSTSVVESVGMALFALYHVAIIIVLINMLIAMMSHSFEDVQEDCDVEWKFARTKLWLNFIDNGSTLPVPFNLVPTPMTVVNAVQFVKKFLSDESLFITSQPRSNAFVRKPLLLQRTSSRSSWSSNDLEMAIESIRKGETDTSQATNDHSVPRPTVYLRSRREMVCRNLQISAQDPSYSNIIQRLVRRYLFKMERDHDSDDKPLDNVGGLGAQEMIGSSTPDSYFSPIMEDKNRVQFADDDGQLHPGGIGPHGENRRSHRRPVNRRKSSLVAMNSSSAIPHVIAIPQLDAIQRTQKILDMRLCNLQAQSEELNAASGNARILENLEHIRDLIAGNQEATSCLVKAVAQIKDQISLLNKNMEQWTIAQASGRTMKTTIIEEIPASRGGSKRGGDEEAPKSASSETKSEKSDRQEKSEKTEKSEKPGKQKKNFKFDL